uniref:GC-rich sequence DNA-binding factor 2 n=1 Tax=Seriola dumerili TaxID=41447 RepID=A0A3B4T700_SERDU
MFNKKPRRNFRQRKDSSSDEEDRQKNSEDGGETEKAPAVVNKQSKVAQGRGISCSSKKPDSSDGEDEEKLEVTADKEARRKDKGGGKEKTTTALSFSDDKEAFKLKKSSDKAVLFQVRRKEASPAKTTYSTGRLCKELVRYHSFPVCLSACLFLQFYVCQIDFTVVIPNAEEIQAARRQRRATRAQKEFISLSRGGQSSGGSTPDHYSRDDEEDRVDDDDDEPDDHERRIEFAPRLKSIRERIAEKLGGSDGSLSGTDGEEQELWEETQIGKGVKRRPGEQSPSGSESSRSSRSSSSRRDRQRQKKRSGVRIPKTLPSISVSMVKRRITGKLDSLKEVHRARQAELRKMEGDVESAKTSVESLEESSSEIQLKFYRGMTLYAHNLVECLREKVVKINSFELELHTLLSDQLEALLAQRRQKVKEQADSLQQLSCEFVHLCFLVSVCAFEMNCCKFCNVSLCVSSDILLRSQTVFSDVQDDFCNVKKILSRFEEWRKSYSDSYHSAYISLCLPKLLNPIIRHQLLAWNPLKDASGDFENLPWFTAVETFCHGHGHEELEHTDRRTLSNVIEKTVLPKITAFVELVWDPMSHQQSVCLSDVCHRLKEDYSIFEGEQSKPVKAFIEAVVRRLRSCVDEDVFIPLYPKKFLEDRSSPQSCFREQQLWTAIKLLGNMGKWDLLLPETVLMELMLDKLLNRYLMTTLCSQTQFNNTVLTCKKIADSLPLSLFKGGNICLPQLRNFENHLVQKVHTLCKQQSPEDPNTRSAVVEVMQVLSRVRCNDSIMAIAEKYHYEDVIYSHQLLNQETV